MLSNGQFSPFILNYILAAAMLFHTLYWGAGLAVTVMPRRWRQFWPILAPSAGLTLQSLVIWAGAYANLAGSNSYAWWSELIPAALLVPALWRRKPRRLRSDLARLEGLWLAMTAVLVLIVTPFARAADFLTTVSLSSCDAADYAAGARVFMEFARSDRTGMLGLTEVVSVMSIDNFFDFWLRLNHFTPSALIALNASILGRAPYEITGLLTAVLLVLSMPIVFWLAWSVVRYRTWASIWIALLYGLSPVTWYAVFQVAPAQLLGAQAIALITWAGVALWRSGPAWQRGLQMSGALAIGYALLLGSYNFMLPVCFMPAGAYVLGIASWTSRWRKFLWWALFMLLPLVIALAMWERVVWLFERLLLFQSHNFGWRIPALTPEGWLGMVHGPTLNGFDPWTRATLATIVVAALAVTFYQTARKSQARIFLVACLFVPALAGYGYLSLQGYLLDNNGSYNAYKMLSVFYPGILAAGCYWLALQRRDGSAMVVLRAAMIVVVSGFTLKAVYEFSVRLSNPPLMVTPALAQLGKLEARPEVTSINMLIPDVWSRLWANAFLLRKPQHFDSHTYEGRRKGPLRGEWDLYGDLIEVVYASGSKIATGRPFSLVSTKEPLFMRARVADGWYDVEQSASAEDHWRWTRSVATTRVTNPHSYPLVTTWHIQHVSSLEERDFQMRLAGQPISQATSRLGMAPRDIVIPEVLIPPGDSLVHFSTSSPLTVGRGPDTRLLGFRVHGIRIEVGGGDMRVPDGK
jgi:hypothetical protein